MFYKNYITTGSETTLFLIFSPILRLNFLKVFVGGVWKKSEKTRLFLWYYPQVYNQTRSQKGNSLGKPTQWGKLGRGKNVRLVQHYTTMQVALALCQSNVCLLNSGSECLTVHRPMKAALNMHRYSVIEFLHVKNLESSLFQKASDVFHQSS